MKEYWVYMLRRNDGTYYTGITNSVTKRLWQHQNAVHPNSYTARRLPVELVYSCEFQYVQDAISWEKRLKGWSHTKKKALIEENQTQLEQASGCLNASRHNLYRAILCHAERRRSAAREILQDVVSIPRLRSG